MAGIPLRSAVLVANPTLDANPRRYSTEDTTNINRVVSRLRYCLPMVPVEGGSLEVRGHDPSCDHPDAEFFDNETYYDHGVRPIEAEHGYQIADPHGPGPSRTIDLKHIASRVDIRDFSVANLSALYPELEFQTHAIKHAVWALWERTMIHGDSECKSAEFDGLYKLSKTRGAGQRNHVEDYENPLRDLDRAIQLVLSDDGAVDLLVLNEAAERTIVDELRRLGCRPDYQPDSRFGRLLYYSGIPTCRCDHIANHQPEDKNEDGATSTIFILRAGVPNGVFAITSEQQEGLHTETSREREPPFLSVQASLYSALVSTTDDALIALEGWPVRRPVA